MGYAAMLLAKGEIIAEMEAQMRKLGGGYCDWCVGVAKDPRVPLFETHVVEERHDGWLYREAFTPASAREVKDHFVVECGSAEDPDSCDGGHLHGGLAGLRSVEDQRFVPARACMRAGLSL
jgi:hypothetical protein